MASKQINVKYNDLRKNYPYFIYESYNIDSNNSNIDIKYKFNLSDKYYFYPSLQIPLKPYYRLNNNKLSHFHNVIFHIGMIEMISYWKAACSPEVIIKPHSLNKQQILWWKDLYYKGLGEFFHVNEIDSNNESFMTIKAETGIKIRKQSFDLDDENIIPVGGGKDSAVCLELLSGIKSSNYPMSINPAPASWSTILNAGYEKDKMIEVYRQIHPQLLELNNMGFLNGHTPFSALIAFISILISILTGKKNICLSNESSANEATIPGTTINHQYSKSFQFEKKFRDYITKNISGDINYFSFLRPLNELQIAKLLSEMPKYLNDFRSCNRGSKSNTWCGECSKCLFTYIMLSPYLDESKLIEIFGKNLLDDRSIKNIFDELTGISHHKPFECIGTIDEVNTALCMTIKKETTNKDYFLLNYYKSLPQYQKYIKSDLSLLEKQYDKNNFLPDNLKAILKKALCLEI